MLRARRFTKASAATISTPMSPPTHRHTRAQNNSSCATPMSGVLIDWCAPPSDASVRPDGGPATLCIASNVTRKYRNTGCHDVSKLKVLLY